MPEAAAAVVKRKKTARVFIDLIGQPFERSDAMYNSN